MASTAPVPPAHISQANIDPALAWVVFSAMIFGNFMAILDIQIVASSLNEIQAGLGASMTEVSWVQTGYLIAEIIAIPLSGFLARLLSTRIFFSICSLGFALSSMLCAFAWDINSMLVFRAIQGFLAGGMIPTTMAALFMLFPPSKQTIPLVLVGMVSTLGPAIGPTLGGWLTNNFSWHWMFIINLPFGVIIAAQVFASDDLDKPEKGLFKHIDWFGLISMAFFLGCLEYVLDEGPRNDWFSDSHIIIGFITMLVAGISFFWHSLTHDDPIVDIKIFADRNFAIGSIITFIVGIALYGLVYILPLFLGQVRGMNASQIGHIMMVMGVTMFFFAPFAGSIIPKFDARITVTLGLLIATLGIWLNAQMTIETGYDQLFLPQVLRGIGMMLCLIVLSKVALATLPLSRVQDGSGLYNLTRNLGGAIGLALINTLFDKQNALHYQALISQLAQSNLLVQEQLQLMQGAFSQYGNDAATAALHQLAGRVHLQAMTRAFNDLLLIIAWLIAGSAVLIWFIDAQAVKNSDIDGGGH